MTSSNSQYSLNLVFIIFNKSSNVGHPDPQLIRRYTSFRRSRADQEIISIDDQAAGGRTAWLPSRDRRSPPECIYRTSISSPLRERNRGLLQLIPVARHKESRGSDGWQGTFRRRGSTRQADATGGKDRIARWSI